MPTFSPLYIEPGAYPKYEPAESFPVVPGGVRVLALIGSGSDTKKITQEAVTKGVLNTIDALANEPVSIERVYTATEEYIASTDYLMNTTGVDWSPAISASITAGNAGPYDFFSSTSTDKELLIKVDDDTEFQTITFVAQATPSAYSASEVVDVINAQITGATASVVVVDGDDYVEIASDTSNDSYILIGDGTANTTLGLSDGVNDEGSKEPEEDSTYYVDYTIAKTANDYTPKYYFSPAKVKTDWGEPSTDNSLSLATDISYENGAVYWLIVPLNPNDGSKYEQFQVAFDKIKSKDCNVVVPLTTNENIFSVAKAHAENMSTQLERKWRQVFLGVSGNKTVSEMQALATGLGSRRVTLVYPEAGTRQISGTATTLEGSYIAAALGGIRVNPNYDVATPLTRQDVLGFTELKSNITLRTAQNTIANAGVCIVEDTGASRYVRHGKTTSTASAIDEEISITDITDYTSEVTYRVLENVYVGRKITNDLPIDVHSTINGVLGNLVLNELITDFDNIQVEQNELEPRQVDVTFSIAPVFPANWFNINFTIAI